MLKTCIIIITTLLLMSAGIHGQDIPLPSASSIKGKPFQNITLEVSLKPFKKNSPEYIKLVAKEMFTQWQSLLRHTDTVSIMLWTSDGSEILDYRGKADQPFEWAKYMGNPNTGKPVGSGPKELSLHERAYLYMDNPPVFTYADLTYIISTLKETGRTMTGKYIRVGATFDPGPEFAISDFKYRRHTEILGGNAMGKRTFVNCYANLNADTVAYAGFAHGIPANTPFGTFFGRQASCFLRDMGYDYIWFSNGFGFGVEGWSSTGAIFDGHQFLKDKLGNTKKLIGDFWRLFRIECPGYPIETRGTNISAGIDLARDGVDLNNIYFGNFNLLPPPNSPWAAIDGDFGLELTGYMSRMAEIPDNRYLYRYYTHDPWWLNSPWFDRYGGEPHDIYLPMSVSRIDAQGNIGLPTHLNFLTIDNSYGDMPARLPDEVIPHILRARYDAPTAPGPLVWVYPFDEYFNLAYKQPDRLAEIYFGDWFIRQAINNGFPLNTVISTGNLTANLARNPQFLKGSVLVTTVPEKNSASEKALINFVKTGGQIMVYGPAGHAGPEFLDLINLKNVQPLEGEFRISLTAAYDSMPMKLPGSIRHSAILSGGGIATVIGNMADPYTVPLAAVDQQGQSRNAAWVRVAPAWNGGKVVYIRGTNSSTFTGDKLLKQDDPETWFIGPLLCRYALKQFGLEYYTDKARPGIKSPVLSIGRSDNAWFFSGYVPNTTVSQRFRMSQGAPLFTGYETVLRDGFSVYNLPTAWHKECRIFITQQNGMVSCREGLADTKGIRRRLHLTGLQKATVTIYPEDSISQNELVVYLNSAYPWKEGKITAVQDRTAQDNCFTVKDVTGTLDIAW